MNKYLIIAALAATSQGIAAANAGGPNSAQSMALGQPGTNLYTCSHPNLPNSKQACDAIVLANDYNSMVQLCSSGLTYNGQNGVVDFCGQLSNAPAASLTKAVDANSNGQGVQLDYICMHPTAHGMTKQLSQQACNLLSSGLQGGSYNAAMGAIKVCTSGFDESFCQALAREGGNANVIKAIGDNANGKGVQLGYIVMHPTAKGITAQEVLDAGDLLVQGLNGGNLDAATSLVQICASGIATVGSQAANPCTLISNQGTNPNVVQAIGNLAGDSTGSNVLLGYRCEHANLVGSLQACTLLGQATAAGNYQAAFAAVHACAAGVAPQLCTVVAGVANNPNVIQAIGDNSNGKGIDLGAVCKQTKNKSEATAACTVLALGVAGNYDAAVSGIETCITGTAPADSLCKVLQAAGVDSYVGKAIDDNALTGSLNLNNTCMKTNLLGYQAACNLLLLGVSNNMPNAADAAVQVCASGLNDQVCSALSGANVNSALKSAINTYANDKSINLQYRCGHANEGGSQESCALLQLAGISVPGAGSAGGNLNLAALSYSCSHATANNDPSCAQITKAAWAGNGDAITIARNLCGQQNPPPYLIDQPTCTAILTGKIQSGVAQQEPAQAVPAQVVVPVAKVVAPVVTPTAPVVTQPAQPVSSGPSASQIQSLANSCKSAGQSVDPTTVPACVSFGKQLLAGNQVALAAGKDVCENSSLTWALGCSKVF